MISPRFSLIPVDRPFPAVCHHSFKLCAPTAGVVNGRVGEERKRVLVPGGVQDHVHVVLHAPVLELNPRTCRDELDDARFERRVLRVRLPRDIILGSARDESPRGEHHVTRHGGDLPAQVLPAGHGAQHHHLFALKRGVRCPVVVRVHLDPGPVFGVWVPRRPGFRVVPVAHNHSVEGFDGHYSSVVLAHG